MQINISQSRKSNRPAPNLGIVTKFQHPSHGICACDSPQTFLKRLNIVAFRPTQGNQEPLYRRPCSFPLYSALLASINSVIEGVLRAVLVGIVMQSRFRRCRSTASRARVRSSHRPKEELPLSI